MILYYLIFGHRRRSIAIRVDCNLPKEAASGAVTGITDTVIVGHQSVRMTHTIHQQITELGRGYHRRKFCHCGNSLLELVSVMGLIAAMMTFVVPAFSTSLAQGRVITASHDMMADLKTRTIYGY
ncbi:MAG: hypothetical protein CM1200mP41_31720 [Gammaproteobacteria bacterium]|nr:MAG: hypothetical protein CM1200mP41_31720 [Gammaproteobacteria bacterium]